MQKITNSTLKVKFGRNLLDNHETSKVLTSWRSDLLVLTS